MRELDIRENLLKATEKRIEARIKELEESFGGNPQKKKEEAEAALSKNLKSLVVMYENMKAKDAAKIFDRLELGLLAMIANQINPRRMSDILAQMSPEVAERLTVELANKATGSSKGGVASGLPKIEGRPDGPPDGT
jgi:flagellar motility protein MotE (MotC chaperone)